MTDLVECPLCYGTKLIRKCIGVPDNGIWIARIGNPVQNTMQTVRRVLCPFCEVDHPGRVRQHEATAFMLRFSEQTWIQYSHFEDFMNGLAVDTGELVECPRCTPSLGKWRSISNCYLCRDVKQVPKELAVAYRLLATDGMPNGTEVVELRDALEGAKP